jgi:pimeloyl-ACP methyl ester carboxylesterase
VSPATVPGSRQPGDARRPPRRPSLALLAMEGPRAGAELAFFATFRPLLDHAPRGDGHPVLVLPGMGGGDRSTVPMRAYLRRLGYDAQGWGLGVNQPSRETLVRLGRRFAQFAEQHDHRPISLIGWSLGGIYARELARADPVAVRQVITLGSPFRDAPGEESHPGAMLRMINPDRPRRRIEQGPLAVPSTAIFSRSDGIVPWRASRDVAGRRAESIEVISSHCGLGHHPGALWAIADRLAQPLGEWHPFRPGTVVAALYPPRRRSATT